MTKLAEPFVNGRWRHRQGTKPESDKARIVVLVFDKSFALVYLSRDSRFHSKNNTSELHLLTSRAFFVLNKTRIDGTTDFLQKPMVNLH